VDRSRDPIVLKMATRLIVASITDLGVKRKVGGTGGMFRTIQATTSIGEERLYWRSRFLAEMPWMMIHACPPYRHFRKARFLAEMPWMMIPRSTMALFTSLPFHDDSNPVSRGMNY
jgi:hypothetical protein